MAASSILLLHFIGLIYTTDFGYASNDIRIKIPLFVLPLIFSTSHVLPEKIKHLILKFFILSLLLNTIITFLIGADIVHRDITDMRYASIFVSHIRLSLLVCVAFFSCIYLIRQPEESKWRWMYMVFALWMIVFLLYMGYITGISALCIVAMVLVIYQLFKLKNTLLKYGMLFLMAAFLSYSFYFVYSTYKRYTTVEVVEASTLDPLTAHGNPYVHDGINKGVTENGRYVWNYYCESELKEGWYKRSKFDYNWRGKRGDVIRFTLVRFLTSKGLRKDADGIAQLSDDEIKAIEKGIANVDFIPPISGRICEIIWELQLYKETGDANGHSITQRLEFWKAAETIISEHPVFGVGTGDAQLAFNEQYDKTNSSLTKEWRLRSHNQYLAIMVTFGIFGLIWFLFALVYPAWKLGQFTNLLYLSFFVVAVMSFFTEDTLETQIGVTFYAFLNSFFLFVLKKPNTTTVQNN